MNRIMAMHKVCLSHWFNQ